MAPFKQQPLHRHGICAAVGLGAAVDQSAAPAAGGNRGAQGSMHAVHAACHGCKQAACTAGPAAALATPGAHHRCPLPPQPGRCRQPARQPPPARVGQHASRALGLAATPALLQTPSNFKGRARTAQSAASHRGCPSGTCSKPRPLALSLRAHARPAAVWWCPSAISNAARSPTSTAGGDAVVSPPVVPRTAAARQPQPPRMPMPARLPFAAPCLSPAPPSSCRLCSATAAAASGRSMHSTISTSSHTSSGCMRAPKRSCTTVATMPALPRSAAATAGAASRRATWIGGRPTSPAMCQQASGGQGRQEGQQRPGGRCEKCDTQQAAARSPRVCTGSPATAAAAAA